MQDLIPVQRVLISVSDKSYLGQLVSRLFGVNQDLDILSSGGTYRSIRGMGYPAREVSEYTGFPESPDGLVKTLHPAIHGGILLNPDIPDHALYMKDNGVLEILPINIVVVNFYPFRKMVEEGAELERLRTHGIDVGGPSMVRSAAKSFTHVAAITDSESYEMFMEEFSRLGATSLETRFKLARLAFGALTRYYAETSDFFATLDPATVSEYYAKHFGLR